MNLQHHLKNLEKKLASLTISENDDLRLEILPESALKAVIGGTSGVGGNSGSDLEMDLLALGGSRPRT